jgi:hypothetical protein
LAGEDGERSEPPAAGRRPKAALDVVESFVTAAHPVVCAATEAVVRDVSRRDETGVLNLPPRIRDDLSVGDEDRYRRIPYNAGA